MNGLMKMATDKETRKIALKIWKNAPLLCDLKVEIFIDILEKSIKKGIEIGKKEGIQIEQKKLDKYKFFHDHIKEHLTSDQEVICKICGRSIDDIWDDIDGSK